MNPSIRLRPSVLAICVSLLCLGLPSRPLVAADTVPLSALPTKGKTNFILSPALESVGGNGYQPLRLTFNSTTGTFPANQQITVAIGRRSQVEHPLEADLYTTVEIPAGAKVVTHTVLLPRYQNTDGITMRLYEDGRLLEGGETLALLSNNLRADNTGHHVAVGILRPAPSQTQDFKKFPYPDTRTLLTTLGSGPIPEDPSTERLTDAEARRIALGVQSGWVQFRELVENDLPPPNWLAYSQLDVILAPRPVLLRIAQQDPPTWKSLQDWVAAGGHLWIYGPLDTPLPDELRDLPWSQAGVESMVKSEQLLSLLNISQPNDTSALQYNYWQGTQRISSQQYNPSGSSGLLPRKDFIDKLEKAGNPIVKKATPAQLRERIERVDFGIGSIIILLEDDPFPGSFQFWESVKRVSGQNMTLTWEDRHGFDVNAGCDRYWGWLISSVGSPPVKWFLLLNTLFAFTMGPFCYTFFRRRDRLYLLYFFAPCCALVAAGGLLLYAILADGIHTRARIRQITYVDPVGGYSLTHSRQTYFANLGSSQGVDFPVTAGVYPVINGQENRHYAGNMSTPAANVITLQGDRQRFHGQFLPARRQVQFFTVEPKPFKGDVQVDFQAQPPTVTHDWKVPIRRFVVKAPDGTMWYGRDLVPGQTTPLEAPVENDVAMWLGVTSLLEEPTVPVFRRTGPFSYLYTTNPSTVWSYLETKAKQSVLSIGPNTYLGVTDLDEEGLGNTSATRTEAIHLLMGKVK